MALGSKLYTASMALGSKLYSLYGVRVQVSACECLASVLPTAINDKMVTSIFPFNILGQSRHYKQVQHSL